MVGLCVSADVFQGTHFSHLLFLVIFHRSILFILSPTNQVHGTDLKWTHPHGKGVFHEPFFNNYQIFMTLINVTLVELNVTFYFSSEKILETLLQLTLIVMMDDPLISNS